MKRQDELNEAWCKYMGKCSTEILQALAFALRWCDEHPNWISVEDELPKEDGRYLFYHDRIGVQLAYYYNDLTLDKAVTHWMPRPQAPLVTDLNKKNLPPVSWQEGNILVEEEGGKE